MASCLTWSSRKTLHATRRGREGGQIRTPRLVFRFRRIVVLGDTHGQLGDVLWAISQFGLPSQKNVYVINGDIALQSQ